MKRALFIATLLIAVGGLAGTARAQTAMEFCPARLGAGPIAVDATGKRFGYELSALGPRSVTGILLVDTEKGFFSVPFSNVDLSLVTHSVVAKHYVYKQVSADSAPLYVDFPSVVTIRRAWVQSVVARDAVASGWNTKGVVSCAPSGSAGTRSSTKQPPQDDPGVQELDAQIKAESAKPARVALASPANFIHDTCARPFQLAHVIEMAQPQYGNAMRNSAFGGAAIVLAAVAIRSDGKVADAWTILRSGSFLLDRAVLRAAKQSTYAPARAYCRNVPGTYLFEVTFTGGG